MTPTERLNAEHLERCRAVQRRSHIDRVAARRAFLEHYEATLTDDEKRQLEALRRVDF